MDLVPLGFLQILVLLSSLWLALLRQRAMKKITGTKKIKVEFCLDRLNQRYV
uniref:Uncharacterized protein n=1 Tax=Populus trichocarpa TaxID=3694 RepID=A0A3N7FPZ7_POPTR